ncbi:MAG TPA: chemotaxis protein CheB [Beijerinckiaceae bacterium]|nr:chemotaxis protein CheB [Beijerinckiaceae bacterium]
MSRRDIIAIGGFLGAVEAVRKLCRDLPADLAATLFIFIHVGTRGKNLLAGIIYAQSALSVRTAVDDEILRRGHVYVAPPDRHLLVMGDVIKLGRGPRENMARPAIDPLFRSVGMSCGPRCIAVVLSGLLNDGAAGLADVKRCGGTTVVQNPADAAAQDMPRGALTTSDVDYRADIADMGPLLVRLAGEDAGAAAEIPEDIKGEVAIALGRRADSTVLAKLAEPVALTCPDCGGVLSQMKRSPPLRFRCQVGHAYTAEALVTEKDGPLDEAVRVALRIMEERALLTEKMADDARRDGREAAASSLLQRASESRAYAQTLRRGLEQS